MENETESGLREVLERFFHQIQEIFAADYAALLLLKGENLVLTFVSGSDTVEGKILNLADQDRIQHILFTNQPRVTSDVSHDPLYRMSPLSPMPPQTKSLISTPIRFQNKPVGLIDLGYFTHRAFTQFDVSLLETLTNFLAVALKDFITEDSDDAVLVSLHLEREDSSYWLTPECLADQITPYLQAIADIQRLIDQINKSELNHIAIRRIQQKSPVTISFKGVKEAVQLIIDIIVPWRRKFRQEMARLEAKEKRTNIGIRKAEALLKEAEVEKIRLENQRLNLELQTARIQLATEILSQISPQLSEVERTTYLIKLLPSLEALTLSDLEIRRH